MPHTKFQFDSVLDDQARTQLISLSEQILQLVADTTCPTHQESVRIVFSGTSLDDLKFLVSGCCIQNVSNVHKNLTRAKVSLVWIGRNFCYQKQELDHDLDEWKKDWAADG